MSLFFNFFILKKKEYLYNSKGYTLPLKCLKSPATKAIFSTVRCWEDYSIF